MDSNKARTVAVIGGGIAGLTAGLCFARTGAKVTVYEQADELKEVGAGLQVTPNGAAVLRGLGLDGEADRLGLRARNLTPIDAVSGRPIARFDLTRLGGEPYRFFHRADLLGLLATACDAEGVRIVTSARIESADPDGQITLAGGATVRADLVLGADGIHSKLRPVLNGTDAPFFTGQVAWRSVVQMPNPPAEAQIWMAPGQHVVTYPLIGNRLNIVAVQERSEWAAEGWNFFDSPEVLQAAFASCAPRLRDILGQVQTTRLWGLFRHPVAPVWAKGVSAILGDAAHPTLPFLAQGANLALEDAWVLAALCNRSSSVDDALSRYQSIRAPRVARAIRTANANAVNYHLSGLKRTAAQTGLRTLGAVAPNLVLRRFDWLYGYDVTKELPLR